MALNNWTKDQHGWCPLLPAAALLSLVGAAIGMGLGEPSTLSASPSSAMKDRDGDGLPNGLERALNLDGTLADSDGDGFPDAEELARASDPLSKESSPFAGLPISAEVTGYSARGITHLVIAIYLEGGLGAGHSFDLGAVYEGRPFILKPEHYLPFAEVSVARTMDLQDVVQVIDIAVPERTVVDLGNLTIFTLTAPVEEVAVTQASAMNLVSSGGSPFQVVKAKGGKTPVSGNGVGTAIYRPLVSGPDRPASMIAGQMCVQTTQFSGTQGLSSRVEVVSASCETADSSCSSSCVSSVGSTFTMLDPVILVGG